MERSDRELWDRAVGGEGECFGVIFDRHGAAVHAYCRARSTEDQDESPADLVSVVFLEAWRRRQDIVLESESALPWLIGVARRVMSHRARSVRRHRAALARLPHGTSLAPSQVGDIADDVASRLDDERRLFAVRKAFERMRPSDREVLLVCVWGGLDYAAAAIALDLPVGTVRSRLSRARSRLAESADAVLAATPAPSSTSHPAPQEKS